MRGETIKGVTLPIKKSKIKVKIFNGSLKDDKTDSNTHKLISLVEKEYKELGVGSVDIFYLKDFKFAEGVTFKVTQKWDQAKEFFDAINDADIVIFASPVWWGTYSSLIARLMERVGAYDDEYIKSGVNNLYQKVFGCIITASNDGFQSSQGSLYAFASNLGFTIPPESHIFWGTYLGQENNPVDNPETMSQVGIACRNLYNWANLIKESKIGENVLKDERTKVGLDSNDKLRSTYGEK